MVEGDHGEDIAEVGRGTGDSLCARTMARAYAFCEDGRVEMDNNAAERALRAVALGRKNYLFAGSDAGGERAAAIYSLLGSAKLNGHGSGSLPDDGAAAHCRSSGEPHCGVAAMESHGLRRRADDGLDSPSSLRCSLRRRMTPKRASSTCDSPAATCTATSISRRATYQEFLNAESRGRYFLSHIRDHFRYERLAKLQVA